MGKPIKFIFIFVVIVGIGYLFYNYLIKDTTWHNPDSVKYTVDQKRCIDNSECVPAPGCHPRDCVGKIFFDQLKKNEPSDQNCTLNIYSWEATKGGCRCIEGRCKNINDK